MSYAETENEHHEAISTGIVDLRNTVAQLWGSAANQRGQALACEDADTARAYYESSHAYADAAQRVGAVAQHFEESESFRAGAMEAIGPVPTYDELERRLKNADSVAKASAGRVELLETEISQLDAALGGTGSGYTEAVLNRAAAQAREYRRLRGIREHALKIVTDQVEQGQQSLGTLADVVTVLLDGEHPEQLKRIRIALGADVPDPLIPGPLKLEIPPGLAEQFRRVARNDPDDWSTPAFEPSVGQLVTGHDVTDVDGELTTGRVEHVDADFVNVALPKYRSAHGWYETHVALDRTELRGALPQEMNAYTRNLQLVQEQEASVGTEAEGPAPTDPATIPASQLDDTTVYVGALDNGAMFVGLCVGVTDAGRVKLQRPVKSGTATEDWGVRLEEVRPETIRRADDATAREFHKLVDQADAEIHGVQEASVGTATTPEGEWKVMEGTQLDLTPAPEPWVPEPGQIVTVAYAAGQRIPVQFVRLNTPNNSSALVQLPSELQTADGVDHAWETRKVDTADLAPALPHEMNAFMAELEAKGLDGMIR